MALVALPLTRTVPTSSVPRGAEVGVAHGVRGGSGGPKGFIGLVIVAVLTACGGVPPGIPTEEWASPETVLPRDGGTMTEGEPAPRWPVVP